MHKLLDSAVLILGTAAAVSGSILKPRACAADLCYRAVIATQFPDRGYRDCTSYWRTTYTPPTVTIASTVTVPTTFTNQPSVTRTDTIHITVVSTVPSTQSITLPTTFTSTVTVDGPFFKRQEPGNVIPTHASACSGKVRYSSACSCIGVPSVITVTAETPTTFVTVSETTTVTEDHDPITVATVQFPITDATVTTTAVTQTTIYTGPTETVTMFALQVASGPQFYVNQYLKRKQYTGDTLSLEVTTDPTKAERILLHSNGRMRINADFWPYMLYAGGVPTNINNVIFGAAQNFQFGMSPLTCGFNWDYTVTCWSAPNFNTFGIAYGNLQWGRNAGEVSSVGGMVVGLRAIRPPGIA
ncbi:hypothetical protein Dda_7964 [Drechslerella dactyloides]|uniref:Uncharacterized protein n=1 Tax=Drechslerella dactyloides TaxID=74499 RepID=A0AAD6NG91_DREDA|nr:hypothetical protein Dda_7964 [Drechslerella dactyloides]